MTVTWTLDKPIVTAPGVIPAFSTGAPDSPIDVGVPYYHTQADFLALVPNVLSEWYVQPIQASGQGYELFQSYARMFELISRAVGEFQALATLSYSSGGQRALASVQFYRPTLANGAFTIKAGSVVACSKTNRRFQVMMDAPVGASAYFVTMLVVSLGQDSDYNVKGPVVTPDGTVLAGEIDTIIVPNLDPPFAEPNLAVRQVADAYGGVAPVLDQIGDDRGIDRAASELDANYKSRARALADTITPAALRRHLDRIFYPVGLHYDLFETWEGRYQSCWNAPLSAPTDPVFGSLVTWAYNDPRTDRFIPRWMGEVDHRSALALVLPSFPTLADRGMAYNDPATGPTPTRGASAWNSPIVDVPSLSGVYNGTDLSGSASRAQFISAIYALLQAIKGGGVNVALIPAELNEALPGAPFP